MSKPEAVQRVRQMQKVLMARSNRSLRDGRWSLEQKRQDALNAAAIALVLEHTQ